MLCSALTQDGLSTPSLKSCRLRRRGRRPPHACVLRARLGRGISRRPGAAGSCRRGSLITGGAAATSQRRSLPRAARVPNGPRLGYQQLQPPPPQLRQPQQQQLVLPAHARRFVSWTGSQLSSSRAASRGTNTCASIPNKCESMQFVSEIVGQRQFYTFLATGQKRLNPRPQKVDSTQQRRVMARCERSPCVERVLRTNRRCAGGQRGERRTGGGRDARRRQGGRTWVCVPRRPDKRDGVAL